MPDETVATYANLLREYREELVHGMQWTNVLFSEIDRGPREHWDGEKIRVPMVLAPLGGTAGVTETATLGNPKTIDSVKQLIDSAIITIPVSWSLKLRHAARNDGPNGTSWADAAELKMQMAEAAFKRTINEMSNADGTALLAAITANSGGASTTVTVGTSANFYQLYEARYVDIRNRTTGSAVASGTGLKIVSNNPTAGTLVVDVAVTTTTSDGIYIEGTARNNGGAIASDAMMGIAGAAATSGSFQGVDRGTVPQVRGTDASPASAGTLLTIGILNAAERRAHTRSQQSPDFYVGDPAVIDKYQESFGPQAMFSMGGQLATGWEGVKYRNKLLIPEFDGVAASLIGVRKDAMKIYTLDNGPDWDDVDGMFKRFTRSLPYESWLVWMVQLGFSRPQAFIKIGNLRNT